ncbi:MAG: hypothetical protein HKN36_07035 [Hellea sp.]|nr:hypothetical protein [Hellea sp.]
MTKTEIMADLAYVKSVAEEGRNAPLLGGRVGLMWTGLLVPTLIAHGLTAAGKTPIAPNQVGLLWLAFGIIGAVLAVFLIRSIKGKPGGSALANRIESVIWPTTSVLIFGYAIALGFAFGPADLPPVIFDTILPLAFALTAVNLMVLGKITDKGYMKLAGLISGLAMIACVFLIGNPAIYYVAAAGVFLTGVIPSLVQMRNEPQ